MRKLSVCLASFNGEKYIKSQIESILRQLGPSDEIIVSDDRSTDSTLDVVRQVKDERIKIVQNAKSKGYSENFENAITHASGDTIFLSDQDDIWMEGKVQRMLHGLDEGHLVVTDAQFVDQDLIPLNRTFFSIRGAKQGFLNNLYKQRYLGACMAFRRDILSKLLPFPRHSNYCTHDLWITIISEMYYKVVVINEPLILYRRHGENVSAGGDTSRNSLLKMMGIRCYALLNGLARVMR